MQENGHVSLARLFGPGAADYSPTAEGSTGEPGSFNPQITYDELCDARFGPHLTFRNRLHSTLAPNIALAAPLYTASVLDGRLTGALRAQVGVAYDCGGDSGRRCEVLPILFGPCCLTVYQCEL